MGALFGIPDWLGVTIWIFAGLSIFWIYGNRSIRRAHERVADHRPNPTRDEFLAAMKGDCPPEVSEFIWEKALSYVEPRLTPHPEDDLTKDLRIDDDDIAMDWPHAWAEQCGFHDSNLPDWPDGWPTTIRNYGRWLEMGPQ